MLKLFDILNEEEKKDFKRFIRFLKDEGYYHEFFHCYKEYGKKSKRYRLVNKYEDDEYSFINDLEFVFKMPCIIWIEVGFDWSETLEGFHFWSDLNKKWKDLTCEVQRK